MQIEHKLNHVAVLVRFAVRIITDIDALFGIVGAVGFGDEEKLGALIGKRIGIADAEKQMRVFGRIKVHTPLNGRVAVHRRAVQLSVGDLKRAFLRQPAFVVTVAVKIPLVGL